MKKKLADLFLLLLAMLSIVACTSNNRNVEGLNIEY